MQFAKRLFFIFVIGIGAIVANCNAQDNPYREDSWQKLPDGRRLGQTSGIDFDRDGGVWIFERCGANSCAGSNLAPIVKFDAAGKYLTSFGLGCLFCPMACMSTRTATSGSPTPTARMAKVIKWLNSAATAKSCSLSAKPASPATAPTRSIVRRASPADPTVRSTSPTATAVSPTPES